MARAKSPTNEVGKTAPIVCDRRVLSARGAVGQRRDHAFLHLALELEAIDASAHPQGRDIGAVAQSSAFGDRADGSRGVEEVARHLLRPIGGRYCERRRAGRSHERSARSPVETAKISVGGAPFMRTKKELEDENKP